MISPPRSVAVTKAEAETAHEAAEMLERFARQNRDVRLLVEGSSETSVPLPAKAVDMMLTVLESMAEGKSLAIIPLESELTTGQTADFLNVSRPFVCKLIDEGRLPARMINRHRRVKFSDVVAFEEKSQQERYAALEEMAREATELGLE